MGWIEPSMEADGEEHACALDRFHSADYAIDIEINWLLAENRQTSRGSHFNHRDVSIGWGTYQDRIDRYCLNGFSGVREDSRSKLVSHGGRSLEIRVYDRDDRGPFGESDILSMQTSDSANAD
jgi:hypothetical protein